MLGVGFFNTISFVVCNALNFEGRASRRQLWYWFLFNVFVVMPFVSLVLLVQRPWETADPVSLERLAYLVFSVKLVLFVIGASLVVRRLHDTDRSGILALLLFLPIVNLFLVVYLMLSPGTPGENLYGRPPGGVKWQERILSVK